ncbi:MAG TPA: hypothetical protein QF761_06430 [Pirellulales bacterium]|nr:hypothetical protein [Pirellulales bacterium]
MSDSDCKCERVKQAVRSPEVPDTIERLVLFVTTAWLVPIYLLDGQVKKLGS